MCFILIAICINIFEHERIMLKYVSIYMEKSDKIQKTIFLS